MDAHFFFSARNAAPTAVTIGLTSTVYVVLLLILEVDVGSMLKSMVRIVGWQAQLTKSGELREKERTAH